MGYQHVPGGQSFYWPTGKLVAPPAQTPRQAWSALLAREITPDAFGAVLQAWEAV